MTRVFTLAAALWLFVAITPNPTQSSSQPQGMTLAEWVTLVKAYSMAYGVDPNLALALARIEGNDKHGRLRFGLHGRYYLPFGLDKGCNVPRAWTPGGNAEGGIKALARHLKRCHGNLQAALRLYNTGDQGEDFRRYCRDIVALRDQHKRDGVFDK